MEALTPPEEITRAQAWILAARPKTLTAAVAPVLAGVGLAAHHHMDRFERARPWDLS